MPPPLRTYSWIARQPHNVRFELGGEVETDGHPESIRYAKENKEKLRPGRSDVFKRGVLWPSLILVEKAWDASLDADIAVYARIYRRRTKLIVDVALGKDMEEAMQTAMSFGIPVYSVSKSRKGKRGGAQRVQFT